MSDTEQRLARALRLVTETHKRDRDVWNIYDTLAAAILADPQAHVDLLANVGVLRNDWYLDLNSREHRAYHVVRHVPCRYCGDQIEPWTFEASSVQPGPGWRHVSTGERVCRTLAEPANA